MSICVNIFKKKEEGLRSLRPRLHCALFLYTILWCRRGRRARELKNKEFVQMIDDAKFRLFRDIHIHPSPRPKIRQIYTRKDLW